MGRTHPELPPLRDVIREYGLQASKSLGQNFILDSNVTDRIARSAGDLSGINVIEIGPGPGGLTRSVLRTESQKVFAIERDSRAVRALYALQEHYSDRLQILEGDALTTNISDICSAPRAIIANLPYNISTVLLLQWLETLRKDPDAVKSMTLMFQKEVAERITASPSTKAYGRLSVMAQWLCEVKGLFTLPPSVFVPEPKIDSRIVAFKPRTLPAGDPSFKAMEHVTAQAFQQRRKMMRRIFKSHIDVLEKCDIAPDTRPEQLDCNSFIRLAKAFKDLP